jgi:hypothetical protein
MFIPSLINFTLLLYSEFGRIQSDWFRSFSELCEVHGIFAPLAAVARLGQKQFDLVFGFSFSISCLSELSNIDGQGRWIDLIFSEHFAYHSRHAAILTDWLNDAHSSSTSPAVRIENTSAIQHHMSDGLYSFFSGHSLTISDRFLLLPDPLKRRQRRQSSSPCRLNELILLFMSHSTVYLSRMLFQIREHHHQRHHL